MGVKLSQTKAERNEEINKAITDLSVSGKTITYKRGNGKTGTLTTQDTDTKNTAGSTDTSSKIFLVGTTAQAANPQTYSDNQVYAENGKLNGNKIRVAEKVTLQYNASTEALEFVFE